MKQSFILLMIPSMSTVLLRLIMLTLQKQSGEECYRAMIMIVITTLAHVNADHVPINNNMFTCDIINTLP